tara:strand:- start:318 stop:545 length:228 start_codon:yes stop_codon:yes gene_type:complete
MKDEIVIAGRGSIPVIKVPTKLTIKNKKTGKVYSSPEEAKEDVNDPKTETKGEDIQQDCSVQIQSLPELFAKEMK